MVGLRSHQGPNDMKPLVLLPNARALLRKQGQAKVGGGRVPSVDQWGQIGTGCLLGAPFPRLGYQYLGEDSAVSLFVWIGQFRTGDGAANAWVIERGGNGVKTGRGSAQMFSAGQLGKSHARELVQGADGSRGTPMGISLRTSTEISQGQEVHYLDMHGASGQGLDHPGKGIHQGNRPTLSRAFYVKTPIGLDGHHLSLLDSYDL